MAGLGRKDRWSPRKNRRWREKTLEVTEKRQEVLDEIGRPEV
jgi:hypothetical protein